VSKHWRHSIEGTDDLCKLHKKDSDVSFHLKVLSPSSYEHAAHMWILCGMPDQSVSSVFSCIFNVWPKWIKLQSGAEYLSKVIEVNVDETIVRWLVVCLERENAALVGNVLHMHRTHIINSISSKPSLMQLLTFTHNFNENDNICEHSLVINSNALLNNC